MSNDKFIKSNLLEIVGTIVFLFMYYLLGIHYFPIILLFFPTAFIVIGIRKGIVHGLLSLIVVSIGIVFSMDALTGIISFLLVLPITLIIIYGMKSRKKPMEILAYSTVAFFISALLMLGYSQNISGVSIISQMEETFKETLNFYVEVLGNMELTSFEIQKTKGLLENGYKYMTLILPATLIIFSLFISYCNYYTSVLTLRKMGIGVVNLPRFSKFKLPSNIISGTIVMILGVLLIKEMNLAYYETIFLNIAVLISAMFLIQGLSVVDFYLIKLRINLIFRIIFIMVMAILAPLGTLISLVGITDVIFDYRKFRKLKS